MNAVTQLILCCSVIAKIKLLYSPYAYSVWCVLRGCWDRMYVYLRVNACVQETVYYRTLLVQ
jgi:hypothetical protein